MVRTAERKRGGLDESEAPAMTFADPGEGEVGICFRMAASFLSFCGFQGLGFRVFCWFAGRFMSFCVRVSGLVYFRVSQPCLSFPDLFQDIVSGYDALL